MDNPLYLHSAGMRMGMPDADFPLERGTRIPVEIDPGGFFAAHYHPNYCSIVADECEIYEMTTSDPDAAVCIFLRNPDGRKHWSDIRLSAINPWVLIPPRWHHAGLSCGKSTATFNAHTRLSHTKLKEEGGNLIWLPDDDQPYHILRLMQHVQTVAKTA